MIAKKGFYSFSRGFQTVKCWENYLTAWHGRSRFEKIMRLLEREKVYSILDIACGNGFFLRRICPEAEKYGIDIIEIEKPDDFNYIQSNLEYGLPFKNESFDVLIAGEIIEHLLNTDSFLRECFRILKYRGLIILTTPNLCSLKNLFLMLQGKQPIAVDFSLEKGVGHLRAFSPQALTLLLRDVGFKIEHICSDRIPIPFVPAENEFFLRVEQTLGDCLKRWGNVLIAKAKKL